MQAKHKVSKLLHTTKSQYYTERIALQTSRKEQHQIGDTLTSRHPPKSLPTIYIITDLQRLIIKHLNNKINKFRANIALDSVTLSSTFDTGANTATLSIFEKSVIIRNQRKRY